MLQHSMRYCDCLELKILLKYSMMVLCQSLDQIVIFNLRSKKWQCKEKKN